MQENPFEHTTLQADSPSQSTPFAAGNTPLTTGNAIELRYTPLERSIVPANVALSGIVVPIILFIRLQPPMNLIMPAVVAVAEFTAAAFLYFLFNSALVRADDAGISKTQFGRTQSVRWDEIESLGMKQVGNGSMQIHFTDASGKVIFRCSTLGNREDGEKFMDFIDSKLQER